MAGRQTIVEELALPPPIANFRQDVNRNREEVKALSLLYVGLAVLRAISHLAVAQPVWIPEPKCHRTLRSQSLQSAKGRHGAQGATCKVPVSAELQR